VAEGSAALAAGLERRVAAVQHKIDQLHKQAEAKAGSAGARALWHEWQREEHALQARRRAHPLPVNVVQPPVIYYL
jgi:hypothetical protein